MGVAVVRPALAGGQHAAVVRRRLGHRPPVRAESSGVASWPRVEAAVLQLLERNSADAGLSLVRHQRRRN